MLEASFCNFSKQFAFSAMQLSRTTHTCSTIGLTREKHYVFLLNDYLPHGSDSLGVLIKCLISVLFALVHFQKY